MEARELSVVDGEAAARIVRALGQHRYVGGRMHLVHAFAFLSVDGHPDLAEARAWAEGVLADPDVDKGSRDERLFRRSSEVEIAHVLAAFWAGSDDARARAHARLRAQLVSADIALPEHAPFDERYEDDTFPVLVDAGWELLPLGKLDRERHKGAIGAFGEDLAFDAALFEEQSAGDDAYLQELPALGPAELLGGRAEDGTLAAPLTIWTSGPDAYHDYVLRGVLRAAKIEPT